MTRQRNAEQHTFAETAPATVVQARQRVLDTAMRLFYEEGVRTVGVDQLIAESRVTKATFYKDFGSRANLVEVYVDLLCAQDRDALAGAVEPGAMAQGIIDAVVESVAAEILAPGYRGSALLNAAAAYPDREHPVRLQIEAHVAKQRAVLEATFEHAGRVVSSQLAGTLSVAVLGAHGAATLGGREEAVVALRAAASVLLPTEAAPRVGQEIGGDLAPGAE